MRRASKKFSILELQIKRKIYNVESNKFLWNFKATFSIQMLFLEYYNEMKLIHSQAKILCE